MAVDTRSKTGAESLSREEMLARASALVRVLKERAERSEQLRQCPPETVQDFADSGLLVAGNPPRYGGYDVDYDVTHDILIELGRGDASQAWCYAVWTVLNWAVGHFPEQAQEEYFATGPTTLCSSSFDPSKGKATKVPGGYRLSGHWDFSSGCDAATWFMPGAMGPEGPLWLLLPTGDYEIQDTWFVSGLAGTGSKDIDVRDVFVPEHRTLNPGKVGDTDMTGWNLHGRLTYRVPMRMLLIWELICPLIGIADAAIEEFVSRWKGTGGRGRSGEAAQMQVRLAIAGAEVDAAKALFHTGMKTLLSMAEQGIPYSELDKARFSRDKAFVVQLCVQAVNRLFDVSGGRSLYLSQRMQRLHRDAHALSHRDGMIIDFAGEAWGRELLSPGTRP
jgi:3-hydroxy-9,10-secoandrosta-1,3,5(10)-triene-9,17-dione monooxygenase